MFLILEDSFTEAHDEDAVYDRKERNINSLYNSTSFFGIAESRKNSCHTSLIGAVDMRFGWGKLRNVLKFAKQARRKTLCTGKYLILVSGTPKIQNDRMAFFWKPEDINMPVFKKYQMKMSF